MNEPIDAVITWVNGQDKAHADKLTAYLERMHLPRLESAAPTRFNQCGELDYCVRSLLHFAPWLRTIYIVTDAQVPAIIQSLVGTAHEGRVRCVDHRQIFIGFESYLPTFNSLAIETMLWRIDGLSEQFIYLNDDCGLLRPVGYDDFFRDQRLVLRGKWKTQADAKWWPVFKRRCAQVFGLSTAPVLTNDHRLLQEVSARLAGVERRFFHLPHVPFPLKKSIFEQFFAAHPDLLARNASYPLRNRQQFWPISLAYHLAIQRQDVEFDSSLQAVMVNAAHHPLKKIQARLNAAATNPNASFVCMQSIDAAKPTIQALILGWLAQRSQVM